MCDSFDKSKVSIPKYPYGRTPKRVIYEETKRILVEHPKFSQVFQSVYFCKLNFGLRSFEVNFGILFIQGTHLTLTCVLAHGYGCYMYLADESMNEGSVWIMECVLWQHVYSPV